MMPACSEVNPFFDRFSETPMCTLCTSVCVSIMHVYKTNELKPARQQSHAQDQI